MSVDDVYTDEAAVMFWWRRFVVKVKQFFGVLEPDWVWPLFEKLDYIIDLEGVIISIQEQLDADVAALAAAQVAIADEIAALKVQPAAESVDFTGLDAAVAAFQGLVPAPVVVPPVDVPVEAPVDVPVDPAV